VTASRKDALGVVAGEFGFPQSDWLRNVRAGWALDPCGAYLRPRRPEGVATSEAGSLFARLSPERAYCRLEEKLAMLDLEAKLRGFGRAAVPSVSPRDAFEYTAWERQVLGTPHVSLLVRPRVDRAAVANEPEQARFAEFLRGPLVQAP
jgi:hypothetical protein